MANREYIVNTSLNQILVHKHNANSIISPPKLKSKYLSVEKVVITAPRNKKTSYILEEAMVIPTGDQRYKNKG